MSRFVRLLPRNSGSLVHKRFFLKREEERLNLYVRGVGQFGYFFKHQNLACSVTKLLTESSGDIPSESVLNTFNVSLNKYPTKPPEYFTEKMLKGEQVSVTVEAHLFGSPSKGFTLGPRYLKEIHE